ncbi:hypothetical protein ACSYDW_18715 [Paeniglutamicibacter sp. R2-26]|uniref:hypothetical protein n=1 Tax=Paeniglutamicibacter sp. R2-26 TaxID=3144417 RepID=UPI003EE543B2
MLIKGIATVSTLSLLVGLSALPVESGPEKTTTIDSATSVISAAVENLDEDNAKVLNPTINNSGEITTTVQDASVTVEQSTENPIVELDGGEEGMHFEFTLPSADDAVEGEVGDDGTVHFLDPEGAVDTGIQTLDDGSVRATTTINEESAPGSYRYELGLPDNYSLQQDADGGGISLLNAAGEKEGAIMPAWAIDAEGQAVPTRYVIDGQNLIQEVDHQAGDFAYPIVADPRIYYAWWQLFNWTDWHYNKSYKMNQLSISLSGWGRHDAIFAADQFLSSGWNLLKTRYSKYTLSTTMWQQWECHVAAGGLMEWGTFDLEWQRPKNSNWRARIAKYWKQPSKVCNW